MAPDSDLMDVVLMGQSHENLFRGQMGVSGASAGGGGVTQDALERAGLFSTADSNPIAMLTGGSIKPQPAHNQALLAGQDHQQDDERRQERSLSSTAMVIRWDHCLTMMV